MTLLAACCWGALLALAVGVVTGTPLEIQRMRRRDRRAGRARTWLREAGVNVTPLQFVAGSAAVALLVLVGIATITGAPLVAVVPALGVGVLPRAYFARRRAARAQAIQSAWPEALRDVIASLGGGMSLTHALRSLSTTGPEALRDAFSRFDEIARLRGTSAALEVVRDDLDDVTSDRVLEVLLLAHERGGGIVRDILGDLIASTTRDLKAAQEAQSDGLEMRINARAVLVLPWLVLVALTLRPGPFRAFYTSAAGVVVIVLGGAMSALGALWISRLGRQVAEPRVLAREQ